MNNKVSVGGQAVVEGVMMRGPEAIATAVRKPDGSIVYRKRILTKRNKKISQIPFLRGVLALFDAMIIGTKELIFASNEAGHEEEELTDKEIYGTVFMSLAIAVGVFFVLPSLIGEFVFKDNELYANILEALLRLVIFLGYIFGISFLKDIKRVFQYHGAEHKAIANYESEKELNVENSMSSTRFHSRCGTSFLLLVMFISIIIFSIVDIIFGSPDKWWMQILYKLVTRVAFMPLVAAVAYEIQRWTAKNEKNPLAKFIAAPGLWLQKITTKEPDETQMEVAIVSLNAALGNEVNNATEIKL